MSFDLEDMDFAFDEEKDFGNLPANQEVGKLKKQGALGVNDFNAGTYTDAGVDTIEEAWKHHKFSKGLDTSTRTFNPKGYPSSCCRDGNQPKNKCSKPLTKWTTKLKCEEAKCIWGVIRDDTLEEEVNIGHHVHPTHKVKHFNKFDRAKLEFIREHMDKQQKSADPNAIKDASPHDEYLLYDRCGNFVKLKLVDQMFTNPLYTQRKNINFVVSNTPKHSQTTDDISKYTTAKWVCGKDGSGTLISNDRVLSCAHNFAVAVVKPTLFQNNDAVLANLGLSSLNKGNKMELREGLSYLEWVMIDLHGTNHFGNDIAIAKLREPAVGNNIKHILSFGFGNYETKIYGSTSWRVGYMNINLDSYKTMNDPHRSKQRSSHTARGQISAYKDQTKSIIENLKAKGGSGGHSGAMCYDTQYKNRGIAKPFINGIYINSNFEDTIGTVNKINFERFIWICDALGKGKREEQCGQVLSTLKKELAKDTAPYQPLCDPVGKFKWNENAQTLNCYLRYNQYPNNLACPVLYTKNLKNIPNQKKKNKELKSTMDNKKTNNAMETEKMLHLDSAIISLKVFHCEYKIDGHGQNEKIIKWGDLDYCAVYPKAAECQSVKKQLTPNVAYCGDFAKTKKLLWNGNDNKLQCNWKLQHNEKEEKCPNLTDITDRSDDTQKFNGKYTKAITPFGACQYTMEKYPNTWKNGNIITWDGAIKECDIHLYQSKRSKKPCFTPPKRGEDEYEQWQEWLNLKNKARDGKLISNSEKYNKAPLHRETKEFVFHGQIDFDNYMNDMEYQNMDFNVLSIEPLIATEIVLFILIGIIVCFGLICGLICGYFVGFLCAAEENIKEREQEMDSSSDIIPI